MGMVINLLPGHRVSLPKMLMVFRYCEGGELFYYILQKKTLTEKDASMIMRQSFSALKYLHEYKISHR